MTPTWRVWSVLPPEHPERICCVSWLDAARAWAERQFAKGFVPRSGTEVRVICENDPQPRQGAYRAKITMVNAPAFRATFLGLAFEGLNGDPTKESDRG